MIYHRREYTSSRYLWFFRNHLKATDLYFRELFFRPQFLKVTHFQTQKEKRLHELQGGFCIQMHFLRNFRSEAVVSAIGNITCFWSWLKNYWEYLKNDVLGKRYVQNKVTEFWRARLAFFPKIERIYQMASFPPCCIKPPFVSYAILRTFSRNRYVVCTSIQSIPHSCVEVLWGRQISKVV